VRGDEPVGSLVDRGSVHIASLRRSQYRLSGAPTTGLVPF
jgi:hypothetical protein